MNGSDNERYANLLKAARQQEGQRLAEFLRAELPYVWLDAYAAMGPERETNAGIITRGTFDFLYDDGVTPSDPCSEPRLVAAIGTSAPSARKRDDSRLRGWLGRTEETFGRAWDKGHFIAHTIGGAVAGSELNVFHQRRDVNRGWSAAGRRYRAMETYCATHAGVLCWSRPTYTDGSAIPYQVEFGVLRPEGDVWVETFDNWWADGEFAAWLSRPRRLPLPHRSRKK